MHQLVIVVMSIALTALVVTGGVSYMRNDLGVRRITTEQIFLSYRAFDSAVSAYRIANNGSLPMSSVEPARNGDKAPWWQVRPYLAGEVQTVDVNGVMSAPKGMDWYFVPDSKGVPWLCLSTTGDEHEVPEAIRMALKKVSERVPSSTVSASCSGTEEPARDNRIALRLKTQSSGQ